MVAGVGDEDVSHVVRHHAARGIQPGGSRRTFVARSARDPRARDGGNHSGRTYLANGVVARVGDEEIAGGIEGAGARRVQLGETRRAVVSGAAPRSVARGRLQRASGRQAQDAVVAGIHDVQVAAAVGAHRRGPRSCAASGGVPSGLAPPAPVPATVRIACDGVISTTR